MYALLAVEVKPGHIVYYHLELDHEPGACTIDMEREEYDSGILLGPALFGPWHVTATLSGTVVSDRPDYRPPARTAAATTPALPAAEPPALTNGDPT